MFKNRDELQEALFKCDDCNIGKKQIYTVRNEDLLGSYNAKVWIVGINPHCSNNEEECFQEGKIGLQEWKDRARYYFTEIEKKDFCGEPMKSVYSHFTGINKKLGLKMNHWVEGKISYVDFYKTGTKNEKYLKSKIRENKRIKECPNKYFIEQLKIKTPDLLIITGKELRKEFHKRWKDSFQIPKEYEIWKKNISKVQIKEIEWNFKKTEKIIKVVFCMSFSSQNNPKWTKKQLSNLNQIVIKYLK